MENTVKLTRPEAYTGTLRDESGRPWANVRLSARFIQVRRSGGNIAQNYLWIPSELHSLLSTRTDARGAFRLERMPSGSAISVELEDPFLALEGGDFVQPIDEPVKLRARRAGSISGRLLDAAGRPLADANVVASRAIEGKTGRWSPEKGATTESDGSFQLPALHPGTYKLDASTVDENSIIRSVSGFTVTVGKNTAMPAIQAVTAGWITGLILNARTRQPIRDATVKVQETTSSPLSTTITAEDGTFRLKVLPGRIKVKAQAPGLHHWYDGRLPASTQVTVEVAPAQTHSMGQLEVDPGETLQGRIVDEAGAPLPGLRLLIGPYRGNGIHVTTDDQGRFSIDGLMTGKLYISHFKDAVAEGDWEVISPQSVTLPHQPEIVVRLRRLSVPPQPGCHSSSPTDSAQPIS